MILQRDTLERIAEPICRARGVVLVDVRHLREPGGSVVRVLIDRPAFAATGPQPGSGVTLEDCTGVSRDLSVALDVHDDELAGPYRLEVSSPGLERPLVKLSDYERFAGRLAKVQTQAPIDGRRRFTGTLCGIENVSIVLDVDGARVRLPFDAITRGHLVYRF